MKLVRTLLTLLQSPTVTPPEPPPETPSSGGGWAFPQFQPLPSHARIRAQVRHRVRVAVAVAMPPAAAVIRALRPALAARVVASANLPQFAAAITARRAPPAVRVAATVDVRAQLARARAEDQHLVGFLLTAARELRRPRLEPWNPGTTRPRIAARLVGS